MDYIVQELNENNLDEIKDLYQDYRNKAFEDYKFENAPLPIKDIKAHFKQGFVKGYYAKLNDTPKGFLLYFKEPNFAIELNLIHTDKKDDELQVQEALTKKLVYEAHKKKDWKVISYPMIGTQCNYAEGIKNLGFKAVGQVVIDFDFKNQTTLNSFNTTSIPTLTDGIKLTTWNNKYFKSACKLILECFSVANDAKFDPRFLNIEGVKDILLKITQNIYGVFIPQATILLLDKNKELIGICFSNLTTPTQANIPLIAVTKKFQGRGYSKALLKTAIISISELNKQKVTFATNINATTDTDNISAVKMYKSLGFQEKHTYIHAYLINVH